MGPSCGVYSLGLGPGLVIMKISGLAEVPFVSEGVHVDGDIKYML